MARGEAEAESGEPIDGGGDGGGGGESGENGEEEQEEEEAVSKLESEEILMR